LFAAICLMAVPVVALHAQTSPAPNANPDPAAAMQDSLNRQRAAIEKQKSQTTTQGFFVLPRPASLGATTPMPTASSAALALLPTPVPPSHNCDPLPASDIDELVGRASREEGLDEDLLRGVMKQESSFRPCAVSSKGAMGLMQLMPATAGQFGIENPFDAAANVDTGARFLKQLLNRYSGDIPRALGAYNAGPAKVDAAGGVPAIPETVDYVRQIMSSLPFIEH